MSILSKTLVILLFVSSLIATNAYPDEKNGILVLSFDDGYSNWITTIAPEISRVGGVVTGFVNNSRIHAGQLAFEDLRTLQNRYGWEIGTHTYNHYDPRIYIEMYGLSSWIKNELDASLRELNSEGLEIRSLVFPFNKYTDALQAESLKRVESYRRDDENPISDIRSETSTFPGKAVDLGHYVPLDQIFKWIDAASREKQGLFLYGHQVFPDSRFTHGEVASVGERTLGSKAGIKTPVEPYSCLVPDLNIQLEFAIMIKEVRDDTVKVANGDLTRLSKPGSKFMIGPCMGMRLSDFRAFLDYASKRLHFSTFSDVKLQHTSAPEDTPDTAKNDGSG
jgi:peptidoglycan/xylan/chitin deacetylase (PgdA/CDA1 family)